MKTAYIHWLTANPLDLDHDKKMFGLSSPCSTSDGTFKCKVSFMAFAIASGADADRAMKGALVSALNPPRQLKAFLKSEPLRTTQSELK